MAVGSFLCSPACPKQPRTSIPFYKFFYLTIWCIICASNRGIHFTGVGVIAENI
jgi:hypothetical protein